MNQMNEIKPPISVQLIDPSVFMSILSPDYLNRNMSHPEIIIPFSDLFLHGVQDDFSRDRNKTQALKHKSVPKY